MRNCWVQQNKLLDIANNQQVLEQMSLQEEKVLNQVKAWMMDASRKLQGLPGDSSMTREMAIT